MFCSIFFNKLYVIWHDSLTNATALNDLTKVYKKVKKTNKWYLYLLGMFLGTAACYLFGSVWMAYQMQLSYLTALSIGTLPYLPADLIKMLLALLLGLPLRRAMTSASLVLY